uniref:Uncharacterized protein n=1 Tax=Chromera velia CCMP2878 TaxID=1169474 RepID=A0A0G4HMN4_9ALVE|eukprot:Cvel_7532.t1-p1 / transcript=Cvel_7532.t1 / gene=Cvel_7532 / organism=Chromera_velia_CCMP2878 / gene_product=hypothetical protein / transcript_product=hypothetical protein / location=Cvel_scaffold396:21921-27148(+) / protein_length=963 / sequence_SO=supercontig / SO=protein_coding / is_pseudo=false
MKSQKDWSTFLPSRFVFAEGDDPSKRPLLLAPPGAAPYAPSRPAPPRGPSPRDAVETLAKRAFQLLLAEGRFPAYQSVVEKLLVLGEKRNFTEFGVGQPWAIPRLVLTSQIDMNVNTCTLAYAATHPIGTLGGMLPILDENLGFFVEQRKITETEAESIKKVMHKHPCLSSLFPGLKPRPPTDLQDASATGLCPVPIDPLAVSREEIPCVQMPQVLQALLAKFRRENFGPRQKLFTTRSLEAALEDAGIDRGFVWIEKRIPVSDDQEAGDGAAAGDGDFRLPGFLIASLIKMERNWNEGMRNVRSEYDREMARVQSETRNETRRLKEQMAGELQRLTIELETESNSQQLAAREQALWKRSQTLAAILQKEEKRQTQSRLLMIAKMVPSTDPGKDIVLAEVFQSLLKALKEAKEQTAVLPYSGTASGGGGVLLQGHSHQQQQQIMRVDENVLRSILTRHISRVSEDFLREWGRDGVGMGGGLKLRSVLALLRTVEVVAHAVARDLGVSAFHVLGCGDFLGFLRRECGAEEELREAGGWTDCQLGKGLTGLMDEVLAVVGQRAGDRDGLVVLGEDEEAGREEGGEGVGPGFEGARERKINPEELHSRRETVFILVDEFLLSRPFIPPGSTEVLRELYRFLCNRLGDDLDRFVHEPFLTFVSAHVEPHLQQKFGWSLLAVEEGKEGGSGKTSVLLESFCTALAEEMTVQSREWEDEGETDADEACGRSSFSSERRICCQFGCGSLESFGWGSVDLLVHRWGRQRAEERQETEGRRGRESSNPLIFCELLEHGDDAELGHVADGGESCLKALWAEEDPEQIAMEMICSSTHTPLLSDLSECLVWDGLFSSTLGGFPEFILSKRTEIQRAGVKLLCFHDPQRGAQRWIKASDGSWNSSSLQKMLVDPERAHQVTPVEVAAALVAVVVEERGLASAGKELIASGLEVFWQRRVKRGRRETGKAQSEKQT